MQTVNFETSLNPLYIANSIKSFISHGENSEINYEDNNVIEIFNNDYKIEYALKNGIYHCCIMSHNDINEEYLLFFISLIRKFHDSNLKIIQDFVSYEELDDK